MEQATIGGQLPLPETHDVAAWEQFWLQWWEVAYRFAFGRLCNHADAEEVVIQTAVTVRYCERLEPAATLQELVERETKKQVVALYRVRAPYTDRLKRGAQKIVHDVDRVEDVMQAASEHLLRSDSWGPFHSTDSVCGYLYVTALRAALDVVRRKHLETESLESKQEATGWEPIDDRLITQGDAELRQNQIKCIQACLPTLKDDDADILRRAYLAGDAVVPDTQLAEHLGIKVDTAKHRRQRALERIRPCCQRCLRESETDEGGV